MALSNPYYFDVSHIDDSVILTTDDEGKELLRFVVHWAGKAVQARHPNMGGWPAYQNEVLTILSRIAPDFDMIELPELHGEVSLKASQIVEMKALLMDQPSVIRAIQDCFFTHLRPTIDGMNESESKKWIMENAPMDGVVRMLVGMLTPIDSVKKNIHYHLRAISLPWINQLFSLYSRKSGNSQSQNTTEPAHSLSNFG